MAKFSKAHYQIIARDLRFIVDSRGLHPQFSLIRETIYDLACLIAQTFTADNPAFNREHFLAVVRGERPVNSKPPQPPR